MKNVKKLPTKQLEKFSTIFTQLGLVLVLFIVYVTIELETEQKQLSTFYDEPPRTVFVDSDQEIVFVKEAKLKPKLETKRTVFIPDEPVKKVDNDAIETVILNEEPLKEEIHINTDDIIEFDEPTEIIENVPFDFVQQTPVFKGCEGLSKEENKKCFDSKMNKFIQRNFDTDLASELGLNPGIHKIFTQFIIDTKGEVIDIKIRAPHPKLKIETLETIEKLPKFTPGKQNSRYVKVKYSLPITFRVD